LFTSYCRWEHAGQTFFSGEVEPCINGRTVTLGTYFDQDVDGVVARLLGEQLEDGGWNCEVENGSVRSSFAITINVLEGLLAHERATGGVRRFPSRPEVLQSAQHVVVPASRKRELQPGWVDDFAGALTSDQLSFEKVILTPATRAWTMRLACSDPSSSPTARGFWRTPIPAPSTSRSRTAMVGPAGGTRYATRAAGPRLVRAMMLTLRG
jgi:hypothetical protein